MFLPGTCLRLAFRNYQTLMEDSQLHAQATLTEAYNFARQQPRETLVIDRKWQQGSFAVVVEPGVDFGINWWQLKKSLLAVTEFWKAKPTERFLCEVYMTTDLPFTTYVYLATIRLLEEH